MIRVRHLSVATTTLLLVILGLAVVPAQAETADPLAGTPATVRADALTAVQIDGVAWDQAIANGTVFAAGSFATARPAGSAANTNTVARSNILAYTLSTGALVTSFAPTVNGTINAVDVSADGSTVYIGGNFTSVNGVARYRAAALDATTGALKDFAPTIDSSVLSLEVRGGTVYLGGNFSTVGGQARSRVAAVDATTGAVQSGFAPAVSGGIVRSLAVNPDGTKVSIGGSFTTVNGSDNPGYGLALLDASNGSTLPTAANSEIRDAGANAAVWGMSSDADGVYGTGYHFGSGGNLEGAFMMAWDGTLTWVADCHGDTYDAVASGGVVYTASHNHYCGNLGTGGMPQTDPWTYNRAGAFTKAATGVNKADIYGYADHPGAPSPTELNFFPDVNAGTYTGLNQGTWTVEASGDYVVYGGEFTKVNGVAQQGLVRFAKRSVAPNKQAPRALSGQSVNPTVRSALSGTAQITWPGMWDRDDSNLTYKLFRDDTATVLYQGSQNARYWEVKPMSYFDTGLEPGSTHQYRLKVTDPDGNATWSDWVSVTISTTAADPYGIAVLKDGASKYWRLGSSDSTVTDFAGSDDTTAGSGVSASTDSAIAGSSSTASSFNGTDNATVVSTAKIAGPQTFSTEVWFKTTSTTGGRIAGFGDAASGYSSNYDRHIYMDADGYVQFGVWPGSMKILSSGRALNDGQWHQAVATLGADGMSFYIDGRLVGSRADVTSAQDYSGYWRLGTDNTWAGATAFNGTIDDFSVYPTQLTPSAVRDHWTASGRTGTATVPSDDYGKAVVNAGASLFWRLDDDAKSATVADASGYSNAGTVDGSVDLAKAGAVPTGRSAAFGHSTDTLAGGTVVASNKVVGPQQFTEEAWIKTSTTIGGRILGFGTSGTAAFSGSYDRFLYMLDSGKVRFGVYPWSTQFIDSDGALNDGKWHHVAATLSDAGMRLYVDGTVQSQTNTTTSAQPYSGYWRLGGDNVWDGSSSAYFDGSIDEAAVYPYALDPSVIAQHQVLGSKPATNATPVADFSSTVADRTVSFDASATTDDGTIASYSWDFGDGTTDTGRTVTHTFASDGPHTVKLTATDDQGATGSVTKTVTTSSNAKPTAVFSTSATGTALSVDASGSSDADGTIASYSWDFGDGTTGTGKTTTHPYGAGGSYTVSLTVTDDRGATDTATKIITVKAPNGAPKASFVHNETGLSTSVDASASTDADGSIAGYAWDFGDGSTGTGKNADHTYTKGGTYTVSLTVTDNDGATATTQTSITVKAPNVAPKASFTHTETVLKTSVDASASSDADGSIAGYAWDFGDGSTGTGKNADHTYATAGSYTVKLTVTDNDGATDSSQSTVTVSVPPANSAIAADAFGRTQSRSWGTADTGGAWTLVGSAQDFAVNGSTGQITLAAAGALRAGNLLSASATDIDSSVTVSLDKVGSPAGTYVALNGRMIDASNGYRARLKFLNGDAYLQITKVVGGSDSTLSSVKLSAAQAAGDKYRIRFLVTGTTPTVLKAKAWKVGDAEPSAWQLSTSDSTAALQNRGSVGIWAYTGSAGGGLPIVVSVDDLNASAPGAVVNVKPTASFTATAQGLRGVLDASASTDTDGSIAGYAWDFGDGSSGTGKDADHAYAVAGTYTVKLTVTDDSGATDSTTRTVTVTAPAANDQVVNDAFGRSTSGGWGSADLGGAYTPGSSSGLSVAGGQGIFQLAGAGAARQANLLSVKSVGLQSQVTISLDKTATGSGSYAALNGRMIDANNGYRARLKFTSDGRVRLQVTRVVGGSDATLGEYLLPTSHTAGASWVVKVDVSGTSPTSIKAKAWPLGSTEPAAWQLSLSDSTAVLQGAGSVGLWAYASSSVTNAPQTFAFDDLTSKLSQ